MLTKRKTTTCTPQEDDQTIDGCQNRTYISSRPAWYVTAWCTNNRVLRVCLSIPHGDRQRAGGSAVCDGHAHCSGLSPTCCLAQEALPSMSPSQLQQQLAQRQHDVPHPHPQIMQRPPSQALEGQHPQGAHRHGQQQLQFGMSAGHPHQGMGPHTQQGHPGYPAHLQHQQPQPSFQVQLMMTHQQARQPHHKHCWLEITRVICI